MSKRAWPSLARSCWSDFSEKKIHTSRSASSLDGMHFQGNRRNSWCRIAEKCKAATWYQLTTVGDTSSRIVPISLCEKRALSAPSMVLFDGIVAGLRSGHNFAPKMRGGLIQQVRIAIDGVLRELAFLG